MTYVFLSDAPFRIPLPGDGLVKHELIVGYR